jgi:peptidoglycan hydrolase CwlO-like protein
MSLTIEQHDAEVEKLNGRIRDLTNEIGSKTDTLTTTQNRLTLAEEQIKELRADATAKHFEWIQARERMTAEAAVYGITLQRYVDRR